MSGNLYSQFGGNNLFEVQLGNVPGSEPANLISNYNQMNLHYRYKGFKASGRFEYFLNEFSDRRYFSPTQIQLQYKSRSFQFKAGNYYDMLGNGLLLRAYDIPASVFESQGYRVRHGFYRDMFGFSGEYSGDVFRLKALYGKPLVNVLPPTLEWQERRPEDLYSISPGVTLGEQNIDVNYLYNITSTGNYHYSSAQVTGNLPYNFSYNAELAAELGTGIPLFSGKESIHGFYGSLMYSGSRIGGSLEYKNYSNFSLGSAYNDPPTLVREHSYKVLNRSTHIPILTNETGFQTEIYYRFESGHMLTLNASRARNDIFELFVFEEYFAELYSPVGESASLKWFADYARDPFKDEPHRISSGGIFEAPVFGRWSTLAEVEYQHIKRSGFLPGTVHNGVVIWGLSRGSVFSFSFTWEITTDPFLTDAAATIEIEEGNRHWVGVDTKYKINKHHTIAVFMGQRRGGPACASGICYEVLDFTGIELRFTSKF
jgi:hypothetical protein